MIVKFKDLTSEQLAALHQVAIDPNHQFATQGPHGWSDHGRGKQDLSPKPAITVLESKFEGDNVKSYSVVIEVRESVFVEYPEWQAKAEGKESLRNEWFGYKKTPTPFSVIEEIFQAVERFQNFST